MIYYSHVNEDNRIERQLLDASAYTEVVAIAGSGERVLALLDSITCNSFTVVDVNAEALFLFQLKLATLEVLSVEQYLQFCGHLPAKKEKRVQWYQQVEPKLSLCCRKYWQRNISSVEKGIFNAGQFERFLHRLRPAVNLFLGKNFQAIFSGTAPLSKQFPNKRWKFINHLFSLRWIYRAAGNKDVAFISPDADIKQIPLALNKMIYSSRSAFSFIIHLVFKGHLRDMRSEDLPPSLQTEVLQSIKDKLLTSSLRIAFHQVDLLSYVKQAYQSSESSVFYSISDILSFENHYYLEELLSLTARNKNMIVWRTFLRNRSARITRISINNQLLTLEDHSCMESTGMYQVFSLGQKHSIN